jgi:pilus assembly protein CpaE
MTVRYLHIDRDSARKPHAPAADTPILGASLRSTVLASSLQEAIESEGRLAFNPAIEGRVQPEKLRALAADIILVEIDCADAAEMRILAEFVEDPSSPPVIVTAPLFDVQSTRSLLKMGVVDVLPQPISASDLSRVVDSALAQSRPRTATDNRGSGKVISFIKSSGGAGATSLAVQGACAMGRGKKHGAPAVLDFDVQYGSAATIMDVAQHSSLLDIVGDVHRLDRALLQGATVRAKDRFDLLAAPAQTLPIDGITAPAVVAVIATATRTYNQIFIDLPMLWNDWVVSAMAASDAIVLVVRLTVPSLRRARQQIEQMQYGPLRDVPLFVVANGVKQNLFGSDGVSRKDAEKALGRKLDFWIPRNQAMRSAADSGEPLDRIAGGRALSAKIESMTSEIFKAIDQKKFVEAPSQ